MSKSERKLKRNQMRKSLGSKGMGAQFNLEQQRNRLNELNIERKLKGLKPISASRFIKPRGGNLGWIG